MFKMNIYKKLSHKKKPQAPPRPGIRRVFLCL